MKIEDLKTINAPKVFYLCMLLTGLIIYFFWGIAYGIWYDIGLYVIVLFFVSFGVAGSLLYSRISEIR